MWLRGLYRRVRALLRSESIHEEIDEEMRFHIDMRAEENVRRGMAPDEARRAAMLAFGGVDRHKESARDERDTRLLEVMGSEFRHALRGLRLNRGFSVVTTLTLAVGIGATVAVFSFANWVLYRPVPGIVAPDELALVSFEDATARYEEIVRVVDLTVSMFYSAERWLLLLASSVRPEFEALYNALDQQLSMPR